MVGVLNIAALLNSVQVVLVYEGLLARLVWLTLRVTDLNNESARGSGPQRRPKLADRGWCDRRHPTQPAALTGKPWCDAVGQGNGIYRSGGFWSGASTRIRKASGLQWRAKPGSAEGSTAPSATEARRLGDDRSCKLPPAAQFSTARRRAAARRGQAETP